MMQTATIGSYPKVAEDAYGTALRGAIHRWQAQEMSEAQLQEVVRRVTAAVIDEQEAAGLDLITDGQIWWEDLVTPVARTLAGVEINGLTRFYDNNVYYRQPVVRARPAWVQPALVDQFRFASAQAKQARVKAVLVGPTTFAKLVDDRAVHDEAELTGIFADVLHREATALVAAGADYLQLDEPSWAVGHIDWRVAIEAVNRVVDGLGVRTAVYTYFGGLGQAVREVLQADVDVIGLDVVSAPEQLEQLRAVRWSKDLGLGLIDARNTRVERPEELLSVIARATEVVPPERITLSPNCGLEFLPHDRAVKKLRVLAETARQTVRA